MALRKGPGLLAGLLSTVAAGAILACGGDSPLDLIPTATIESTAVSALPTEAPVPIATEAPVETPQAAGPQEYTVQDGDTLSGIAEQFGVTTEAIAEANDITDPDFIAPGDTLIIPAAE